MRTGFAVTLASGMLLIPTSHAAAAEKRIQMKDLPIAVQQAIKEQSKGATILGLTKEVENGKTEYEAELTVNGHGKDISFDAEGRIVSVEEEVPLASLPEGARAAIQKAVGIGKLQKGESVTENGTSFYEATIRKAGKSSEIKVDANGATVK
jgi:uncharacterized membrane protein YkoI